MRIKIAYLLGMTCSVGAALQSAFYEVGWKINYSGVAK